METRSRQVSANRLPRTATEDHEFSALEDSLVPEKDFRLLLEQSPRLLMVLRPDLTIVAVSQERLRATMMTAEQMLGRRLFEVFPDNPDQENPTGIRNLRASIDQVLRTKQKDTMPLQRYDLRRPAAEGSRFEERWWSPVNAPVLDEHGEVKYIIHEVVEMTEHVLMERKSLEQDKVAAGLRDKAEKMEAQLSLDEKNVQRINQQLREANRRLIQSQTELGVAHETLDAYARDLEKKVQERTARLEAILKTSQELIYMMAHDLRAPLRAMRGFTEALLEDYAPKLGDEGTDYARRIHDAAGRLDELISDLLEYGRIAHIPLSHACISLEEEVQAVLRKLAIIMHDRRPEIRVDSPLPVVRGEKVLVENVLANLIENALKFVAPGTVPHIHIFAERAEGKVRLWVEDNGIGIPKEYHQRIFGIFQRLHRQSQFPGTGVGLAIVEKSVEHMGGRVGVESTPNKGSRFWIELPDETGCQP